LKSVDGGVTWNTTGLSFSQSGNYRVHRILIDPTQPDRMLAATSRGVYLSTDGGVNWDMKSSDDRYRDIEFKL
jgi:photosystem II stability/assembly factor-like uncharacterized protein